jgi:hypothetical protein
MVIVPRALADQFWLMSHDDRDGRARLGDRALGLGLASALLGELARDERIMVKAGELLVGRLEPADLRSDPVAAWVSRHLVAERQLGHPLAAWLAFFAQEADIWVTDRLHRQGVLNRKEARRFLVSRAVYVPADMSAAAMPGARVRMALVNRRDMPADDRFLLGLVRATQLQSDVLWSTTGRDMQHVDELVKTLPTSLRELVVATSTAVSEAVMSYRA